MENPRPSEQSHSHAVAPAEDPRAAEERHDLEVAFYPDRVSRDSAHIALTPSRAVRYAEDPDRAAAAAETAASRQIARAESLSIAALWSETGGAEENRVEANDPFALLEDLATAGETDPFADLEDLATAGETGPFADLEDLAAVGETDPFADLDAAHAGEPASAPADDRPGPQEQPAPDAATWPEGAAGDSAPGEDAARAQDAAAERQPWWAAAAAAHKTSWWRRLLRRR